MSNTFIIWQIMTHHQQSLTLPVLDDNVLCISGALWRNFLPLPLLTPHSSGAMRRRRRRRAVGGLSVTFIQDHCRWQGQRHPVGCYRGNVCRVFSDFAGAYQHDWNMIGGIHGFLWSCEVTIRQRPLVIGLHGFWLAGAVSWGGDVRKRDLGLAVVRERTESTCRRLFLLIFNASQQLVCLILLVGVVSRLLRLVTVVFLVLIIVYGKKEMKKRWNRFSPSLPSRSDQNFKLTSNRCRLYRVKRVQLVIIKVTAAWCLFFSPLHISTWFWLTGLFAHLIKTQKLSE